MGVPYEHVNYDFAAADRLSWALSQANDRIAKLASHRDSGRTSLLGDPGSDNWSGQRRNDFDDHFGSEQRALAELATLMLRIQSAVTDATAYARGVNAHAH